MPINIDDVIKNSVVIKNNYHVLGDKKLLQSLVLDALVTDGFDKREAQRMHKEENEK